MENGYLDRKLIGSWTAAVCIPIGMTLFLSLGQYGMAPIAALFALVGWLNMGQVKLRRTCAWLLLGFSVCIINWYWDLNGTWANVFLLYGSAAMLYQSLDEEGKQISKTGCLWAATAAALLAMFDLYLMRIGYGDNMPEITCLSGILGTAETAGLFFSMAALSDDCPRRRYIFCTALGMTGSGLGLLCLGTGLLFKKKDWLADTLWTLVGLSFFICPSFNLWFLIAGFLFWCVPEMQGCIGKGPEKLCFLPFLVSLFNPIMFDVIKGWGGSMGFMMRHAGNILIGAGPGNAMLSGGIMQTTVELGIISAFLLVICASFLIIKPAGYAWMIHLILGASAFFPAPFLFGVGTGMADTDGDELTDGRKFFFVMLIMCLYLC